MKFGQAPHSKPALAGAGLRSTPPPGPARNSLPPSGTVAAALGHRLTPVQRIPAPGPSSRGIIQRAFDDLENEGEVRSRAVGLPRWQVNLLVWAAESAKEYGPLQQFLDHPEAIDRLWDDAQLDPSLGLVGTNKEEFREPSLAQPLTLTGTLEELRGTRDVPSDSEEELMEFQTGLNEGEYETSELQEIHRLLTERDAPHDKRRREALSLHSFGQSRPLESGSDEEDGSGTDSEHSDSEDERNFAEDQARRTVAAERLKRVKPLVRPELFGSRLDQLATTDDVNSVIFKGSKSKGSKSKGSKSKGRKPQGSKPKGSDRPKKKESRSNKRSRSDSDKQTGEKPGKRRKTTYYRKESSFYEPSLNVAARAALPEKPTQQASDDLALLNKLLDGGMPIAEALPLLRTRFTVAQYRGLFYSRKSFDQRTRARHRSQTEVDRPVFSSSAIAEGPLGMPGYYYLAQRLGSEQAFQQYGRKLALEGRRIRRAAHGLRKQQPSNKLLAAMGARKLRMTDRFNPRTVADLSTHLYSEKYDEYHRLLDTSREEPSKVGALSELFQGLPNSSNPKVSTGDVPTHAARYAYGLKPYTGHEKEVLEPAYNQRGRPKHPYSGKLYLSLHPLTDYEESTGPSQLVDLQNQGRTNISQMIIPERESAFDGLIESHRVKAERKAKFPDFSGSYKAVYAEKYGIDAELFKSYQSAFARTKPGSPERTFVEASLSKQLAMHSETMLIEQGQSLALERRETLVYRTGARSFGFDVPEIRKGAPVREEERPEPPSDHRVQVAQQYGQIVEIGGRRMECYLRSLITGGLRAGRIPDQPVEQVVSTIADHLRTVGLRPRNEMIDAGSLTAAEARQALTTLYGFDPEVHVVMWNPLTGLGDFVANTGTTPIWLYSTPGHFDLILRS